LEERRESKVILVRTELGHAIARKFGCKLKGSGPQKLKHDDFSKSSRFSQNGEIFFHLNPSVSEF
jgi:hypothetical protein